MLRVTGHPGIRIAAPPFYSTAVAVKWVLSFDGSHGSGETRTRTGDTMIFSHMSRPLGMRFYRISKRISVHRVSLDIARCRPYCCTTVDTAFVTLRDTGSGRRTSARLTRLLGYSRPPLSFGDVSGSASRSVSLCNFAEKQEKESRRADRTADVLITSEPLPHCRPGSEWLFCRSFLSRGGGTRTHTVRILSPT